MRADLEQSSATPAAAIVRRLLETNYDHAHELPSTAPRTREQWQLPWIAIHIYHLESLHYSCSCGVKVHFLIVTVRAFADLLQ